MRTLAHTIPAPSKHSITAFRVGGFDTVSAYNAVKATSLAVLGLVLDDTARVRRCDVDTIGGQ